MRQPAVTVVGVGDDGCAGLSSRAFNAIARAQVLVGGERHLGFFHDFQGQKLVLKSGFAAVLDEVERLSYEQSVVVLASGDPLFFGVGSLVVRRLGAEHVGIIPQPSAMQWAFAKIGCKWDDAEVLSVHGRSAHGFLTKLRTAAKVACFTDAEQSPQRLAEMMLTAGMTEWDAWVCENLCGPGERVRRFAVADLAAADDIGPLNMLILLRQDADFRPPPVIPYLPEEAFAKRMPKLGLITKREVRLLSLAQLHLRPDSVVWDVGAGSGSVAIEAAMLARRGQVYAVECDPDGVAICEENLRHHRVDNVHVISGRAPEALAGLAAPDAVFIGGSKGSMQPIVQYCYDQLRPGGRLVVNAVTVDNVSEAYAALSKLAPELTVVNISRGVPLAGRYLRYEALNPIHIFAVTKTAGEVS